MEISMVGSLGNTCGIGGFKRLKALDGRFLGEAPAVTEAVVVNPQLSMDLGLSHLALSKPPVNQMPGLKLFSASADQVTGVQLSLDLRPPIPRSAIGRLKLGISVMAPLVGQLCFEFPVKEGVEGLSPAFAGTLTAGVEEFRAKQKVPADVSSSISRLMGRVFRQTEGWGDDTDLDALNGVFFPEGKKTAKGLFPWTGSKERLVDEISKRLPPTIGGYLLDLFSGSLREYLRVFYNQRKLEVGTRVILADVNYSLMRHYSVVEDPLALELLIQELRSARYVNGAKNYRQIQEEFNRRRFRLPNHVVPPSIEEACALAAKDIAPFAIRRMINIRLLRAGNARIGNVAERFIAVMDGDSTPAVRSVFELPLDELILVQGVLATAREAKIRHFAALIEAQIQRIREAAELYYLNRTCFGGRFREDANGFHDTPFGWRGIDRKTGKIITPYQILQEDKLRAAHHALRGTTIVVADYRVMLEIAAELLAAGKDVFVYADPEYVPVTKSKEKMKYSKSPFGPLEQWWLANRLRELDAIYGRGGDGRFRFMAHNSEHPNVREWFDGFAIDVVNVKRGMGQKKSGPQTLTPELIIKNY